MGIEFNQRRIEEYRSPAERKERDDLLKIRIFINESVSDSNEAHELGNLINEFKDKFDKDEEGKRDGDLKDYLLGADLLFSNSDSSNKLYSHYDTDDHEIRNFILCLYERQKKERTRK